MDRPYSEAPDRALQLDGSALSYMKTHDIATNPNNFLVWYEYFAGSNPNLRQAHQPLLQGYATITDRASAKIHSLFSGDDKQLEKIKTWTHLMVTMTGKLSAALQAADSSTQHNGAALSSFSDVVEVARKREGFAPIVSVMTRETQAAAQIKYLQFQVANANVHVAQLTDELGQAREDAMFDALTGVANRKGFDITLAKSMAQETEETQPLALILATSTISRPSMTSSSIPSAIRSCAWSEILSRSRPRAVIPWRGTMERYSRSSFPTPCPMARWRWRKTSGARSQAKIDVARAWTWNSSRSCFRSVCVWGSR